MFVMLEISQIVKPFNPQWSQNVAHNCDHATFSVDCCYDILQHLLRTCMSTEASVKFQAIHHAHRQPVEIFRDVNLQTKYILSVSPVSLLCHVVRYKRLILPLGGCCCHVKNFGVV